MSANERFVSTMSIDVSFSESGGVCSGVMARPNMSSRGVRRMDGRMRSLSWQIASSKCFGHAYGIDSGLMVVSESTSSSMLGEHRWRSLLSRSLFVPSTRPLHHGALVAVVMCLTLFNVQKSSTLPFLK